jgi:methionyl-tRNA formyltransferase
VRLAYFGTSSFAVPALEALAPWVKMVITQPSRPSGRGNRLFPTPVGAMAAALGIEVASPEKARDAEFVSMIASREFDALVVASYGQILSQGLLDAAKHGGINLHGSILPAYRGAAPIARAILEGETETGVTLMQMDKGMDSGDIIAIERIAIGPDETAGELEGRLAELAGEMAAAWMPRIANGTYPRTPQQLDKATFAAKLASEEGLLTYEMDADDAYRRFRAFTPRPGATLQTDRGPVKLLRCRLADDSGSPGTVLAKGPAGLVVATSRGSLLLVDVQPPGKKAMSWNDLANGWRLNVGDRL